MVIWIVGLSGSGKTSIGREVYSLWKEKAPNTALVDGDEIREVFGARGEADYSVEGRERNSNRVAALCAWLDRQGINVVCCILSIFEDRRKKNRAGYSSYFEVFVDTPFPVILQRDTKGLYAPAMRGEIKNVVGVDIPFTPPAAADLRIDNSADKTSYRDDAALILAKAGVM
ncbi:MAG: adenylyl-sulfate kinase [Nitrospinae bacterium]|nr:adenylyl-sulfate kinase [Nitrospinota bacterium]